MCRKYFWIFGCLFYLILGDPNASIVEVGHFAHERSLLSARRLITDGCNAKSLKAACGGKAAITERAQEMNQFPHSQWFVCEAGSKYVALPQECLNSHDIDELSAIMDCFSSTDFTTCRNPLCHSDCTQFSSDESLCVCNNDCTTYGNVDKICSTGCSGTALSECVVPPTQCTSSGQCERGQFCGTADLCTSLYRLGTKWSNTCPGDTWPLETQEECQEASDVLGLQNLQVVTNISQGDRPKGCSAFMDSFAYWNPDPVGKAYSLSSLVCKLASPTPAPPPTPPPTPTPTASCAMELVPGTSFPCEGGYWNHQDKDWNHCTQTCLYDMNCYGVAWDTSCYHYNILMDFDRPGCGWGDSTQVAKKIGVVLPCSETTTTTSTTSTTTPQGNARSSAMEGVATASSAVVAAPISALAIMSSAVVIAMRVA